MPDPTHQPVAPLSPYRKAHARLGIARVRLDMFLRDHPEEQSEDWTPAELERFEQLIAAEAELAELVEELAESNVDHLFDPKAFRPPPAPPPNVVPLPTRRDLE